MSDFATPDDIVAGLAGVYTAGFNSDILKATITTANGFTYSGWTTGGYPAAGVAPTTWATCTKATLGALNPFMVNPGAGTTGRILYASLIPSVANQPYVIVDRLGAMAGLSGTSVAAQTVGSSLATPAASGRCQSNGSDVQWWLEWYTATGSTAVNVTCAVTYSDDSTGNVVVAIPASVPAFRTYAINSASAGKSIKSVNTVTLSASTLTAGNFGVTAINRKFSFSVPTANQVFNADWAMLGMPIAMPDTCLTTMCVSIGTAYGTLTGTIKAGAR